MMHVFHRSGLDVKTSFEGGVYSLRMALQPKSASAGDPPDVRE
jgi:hypothetical protein